MATRQHKMEEFLSAIVQGKTSVWRVAFWNSSIALDNEVNVHVEVDLAQYPCNVRKDFIHKLRLANISSLAIQLIFIVDEDYGRSLGRESAKLPDGHATLSEDIAEIIKALQSTNTAEELNVVGDDEPQNRQTECNVMEATVSSTHKIEPNNRTLTHLCISGELPPQKLKAICGLTAAPGSTVKSVEVDPIPMDYSPQDGSFQCRVLEEMLSAPEKTGGSCPALESFQFHENLVWSGASVERLGEFLQRTPSIKKLNFIGVDGPVAEKLAEVLCLNNQVHALQIKNFKFGLRLQEDVMRVLMRDSQGQHPISALNCLHLRYTKDSNKSLLCEFVKTTKCLTNLRIIAVGEAPNLEVIEALKFNHGLEHFTWESTYGFIVDEDVVFSTIMDALRVNYQLKDFVYRWANNYYAEALTMLFEERATNKPWEVMKDMVLVPSTSARLFFCGYPHAGKTTLKNTIVKSLREKMEERGSPSNKRKTSHNKFTDVVATDTCDAMDKRDTYDRTRGIEVEAVTTLNNLHLTMWDMGGHDAYHPFHDLVISNIDGGGSSCCFLLLCHLFEPENPTKRKGYMQMANEIKYWLQFIASNTKKSIVYHPHVKLIFTGFDKVNRCPGTTKHEIKRHVQPLREQFKGTLNINEEPFYVNAHNTESIHPILEELEATLIDLFPTLPRVFKACEDLKEFLEEYKEMNPTHTLVKWEVFQAICDKVPSLVTGEEIGFKAAAKRREIVATSLHEAGEVMYYKDLNFVILDPHWFCHDVIGQVISCKDCGVLEPQMGVLPSTSLISFLEESQLQKFDEKTGQDLLKLMKKLDLCIEHVNDSILIPASLCDDEKNPSDSGERKLSRVKTFDKGAHVGRRVAPVDTNRTMLTLGFFPRLQVSFQRSFKENGYTIEKNMISFVWNEMEIILEYSGHIGFHIDIFIRSQDTNESDVYEFLTNRIIKHIFQECSHPIRGCPGVILEESIIRPSCVKDLVLCKNRLSQVISVQMLKENIIKSNSLKFTHAWKEEKSVLDRGYDKALSLLSDTERIDVIGCFSKLIMVARQSLMELPVQDGELTRPSEDQDMKTGMKNMERNLMSAVKSSELVVMEQIRELQTLIESKSEYFDMLVQKMVVLVQDMIQNMLSQSDASISSLSERLQESLTFNVELEQTRCPKFVWFKCSKQRMEAKKKSPIDLRGTKYTVHILCETLIGNHMHEVENQQGIKIKVESKSSAKLKKILKYTLLTLSTLIAIGAHVVAPGIGNLVPEIAKGFLLVLDTPGVLGCALSTITPSVSNPPDTILHAKKEGRKWLDDLLRKCNIKDVFGLYKVRYKNCEVDINGRVAWICKKCKDLEDSQDKIDLLDC